MGCAATFGVGLVAERNAGTLFRLLATPLTRAQVLLGKAAACGAAILGVEALLLLVGATAFHVRPASWGLLAAASVAAAAAFVGLMMFISTLGRTERSASGAGWAILLVMSMLGGGMVPLFVMPAWMATASNVSPVKWAVLALEGALWRGFTPREMVLPCAILVFVGAVAFAAGVRNFRTAS
jgi:ABC-2 type transport system permease protein